jgi:endoglucanase Acf2
MMMALPHHLAVYNKSQKLKQVLPDPLYRTIKGKMYGILGATWKMLETYGNITWQANRPV